MKFESELKYLACWSSGKSTQGFKFKFKFKFLNLNLKELELELELTQGRSQPRINKYVSRRAAREAENAEQDRR